MAHHHRRLTRIVAVAWLLLHTCRSNETGLLATVELGDKGDARPLTNDNTTTTLNATTTNVSSLNISSDTVPVEANASTVNAVNESSSHKQQPVSATDKAATNSDPVQSGPLINLFGPRLLSVNMVDATHAELRPHYTSDALRGKKVIGVYFSADWCGPCRKFTPELVSFYQKMNKRRGQKDQFEIVWVSRCRDVDAYGKFFTHMGGWVALPPEEAMGERGAMLSTKFKVKGIPTLVLLDDLGQVITLEGRNKIPQDKAGIGFPWRNPLATLYMTLIPRSLRFLVRSQIESAVDSIGRRIQTLLAT